ncbi:hypothetical protein C8R47DRAFT_55855 [Mycena vitilis]|nr:hypothetical protein C8R47DRAFT_55855 [Mycena vitilis]
MASLAPVLAATQLCDYCHQKPKHGTHSYCSKTCAAQIATLCNHCQKKPKYQNFDFCGKNCAALAAGTPAAGNRSAKTASSTPASSKTGRPSGNAAPPQTTGSSLLDPVQIAKLVAQHLPQVAQHIPQVAQHLPQVQSFLAAVVPAAASAAAPAQPPAPAPVSAPPMPAPAPTNPLPKQPRNNPFMNAAKTPASTGAASPSTNANGTTVPQPSQQPLDCIVCGQPVHIDASGVMSDYCSKKHREEAVSLGLVPPCIMCLTLPQSDTDYFCGRDCREEAMSKALGP